MTVLGFLSVMTFLLSHVGLLELISVMVWGDGEHERLMLFHMLEVVHYSLSFIMVTFLAHALYLYRLSRRSMKKWRAMDKMAQIPEEIQERRDFLRKTLKLPADPTKRLVTLRLRNKALQVLKFASLRNEFVRGRQLTRPYNAHPEGHKDQLPKDFDYGYYLCLSLGHYLGEIIDVSILEWSCIWIMIVVWYGVMLTGENTYMHAWLWVFLYYLLTAFFVVFNKHVSKLRTKVLNPADFKGLVHPLDNALLHKYAEVKELDMPYWAAKALEDEKDGGNAHLKRSKTKVALMGRAPNAYMRLFFFEGNGPRIQSALFTLHLVIMSTYLAVIAIHYAKDVYDEDGIGMLVAYLIIAIFPCCICLLKLERRLLRRIVHINSIGSMRDGRRIGQVLRAQKTGRALRTLVLLQSMKKAVVEKDLFTCVMTPRFDQAMYDAQAKKKRQHFAEEKGPGDLEAQCSSEEAVMLNPQTGQPRCVSLLEVRMTESSDGQRESSIGTQKRSPSLMELTGERRGVSRHSSSRSSHSDKVEGAITPQVEDVSSIFNLYDADNSGFIDIDEMEQLLLSLGTNLSHAQLERMYRLVDTDGDGKVSKEEFTAWHLVETTAEETRHVTPRSLAEDLFSLFDQDEDGAITIEQFKEGLDRFNANLSLDEVASLVRDLDQDGDGKVNIQEFSDMLEYYTGVDERDLDL
mmetsp:Transcript_21616/g.66061  ORF Transcript_21616/g.66061 Transcript_21616/m.66061 type:complete len:689 (-) Transcript_21616:1339-3405(-)